jgi:hypothetical protein
MNPDQAARAALAQGARFFLHNTKIYRVAYEFAPCGDIEGISDWNVFHKSDIVRVT